MRTPPPHPPHPFFVSILDFPLLSPLIFLASADLSLQKIVSFFLPPSLHAHTTFCPSLSFAPPTHFVSLSLHAHNTSFERSVSTEAKTLIRGLLTEDVIQRFTIEDALKDPWLAHNPDRLPVPSPKKLRK